MKLDPEDEHLRGICYYPEGYYVSLTHKGKVVKLHRHLMNCPPHLQVDHINGDILDNRKSNLRICTQAQNAANSPRQRNNTSGYKGVSKNGDSWMAKIMIDKRPIYLGTFSTKELAAKAYNTAAIKYHKEFANLNEV